MVSRSRTGRPPTCDCGSCIKCKRREYMREWWGKKTADERRAHVAKRDPLVVAVNEAKRFQKHKSTRAAAAMAWAQSHPDARRSHKNSWKKRNREKTRAHSVVAAALKSGKLKAPDLCSQCREKSTRLEAHHADYSKPLDVQFLCTKCHGITRRKHAIA